MEPKKLKKKKVTEQEVRALKELFIKIQSDPVAMRQVKRLLAQTI